VGGPWGAYDSVGRVGVKPEVRRAPQVPRVHGRVGTLRLRTSEKRGRGKEMGRGGGHGPEGGILDLGHSPQALIRGRLEHLRCQRLSRCS
jgi:hypothetical protein